MCRFAPSVRSVCSMELASLNSSPDATLSSNMSARIAKSRDIVARNSCCSLNANAAHATRSAAPLIKTEIRISLRLRVRSRKKRMGSVLPPNGTGELLQLRADFESAPLGDRDVDFEAHFIL